MTPLSNLWLIKNFEILIPKWNIFIEPFPLKLRVLRSSLPHTTGQKYIWINRDIGSTHRAYTGSNHVGSRHWERKCTQSSIPNQGKLFPTKNQFLQWRVIGFINHTPRHAPCSSIVAQHETHILKCQWNKKTICRLNVLLHLWNASLHIPVAVPFLKSNMKK